MQSLNNKGNFKVTAGKVILIILNSSQPRSKYILKITDSQISSYLAKT